MSANGRSSPPSLLTLTHPNTYPNPAPYSLPQAHLASLSAYFARFGLWTRYRGNPSLVPPSERLA